MIVGFKQCFPDGSITHFRRKIERGEKIHTIRKDSHSRWHAGRLVQCSHGVRTKYFNCFLTRFCTGTQSIVFRWLTSPDGKRKCYVYVDNRELSTRELRQLAINDGFNGIAHFLKWFHGDFSGKIIHWTLFRY
jgi:uncharacterized protein YqfB (UPF0267 family)